MDNSTNQNDSQEESEVNILTQKTVPAHASKQKQELFSKIWKLQKELRGGLDGWDFKNYILGFLFYRFISDDFSNYIDEQNGINKNSLETALDKYENLNDNSVEDWKADLISEKGFFIYPSQLFKNVVKNASDNDDLNEELTKVFKDIESSSVGTSSEHSFKHLFVDLDINSPKLGHTPSARNKKLSNIITKLSTLDFDFSDSLIDVLGDAYEYLIGQYASNAGKAGGEFFTPQEVSTLLTKLTTEDHIDMKNLKVYDPTCGSGSLLLKFAKEINRENIQKFYGQENNPTTYNLARMNMFLHGIPYTHFDIANGDTLLEPGHLEEGPFDCIVANPPYSIDWVGDKNPLLMHDERFSPAGILAPKNKADFAFVMHILYSLANDGTAAIVEFPGILSRDGAEKRIRQYLIDNNFIDTIIQLPSDLFFGTGTDTCILVLKKNKKDNKTLFIDASREFIRSASKNMLTAENISTIVSTFRKKDSIEYFSSFVTNEDIKLNDYNLLVTEYVSSKQIDSTINILNVNTKLQEVVEDQVALRNSIATLNKEIEANFTDEFKSQVEFVELKSILSFEQPNKYIVSSKAYSDKYETPVLTAGKTFLLGYTNDTTGIYQASEEDPVIIFDDFTTSNHLVTFDHKVKSSALKFLKTRDTTKYDIRFYSHLLKTLQYSNPSHNRHYISEFEPMLIPLLPINIQREIVKVLDKITNLKKELEDKLQEESILLNSQHKYYREKLVSFSEKEVI